MIFAILDCRSTYFKKLKKFKLVITSFLINCGILANEEAPGFRTQSSKSRELFPKHFAHGYID